MNLTNTDKAKAVDRIAKKREGFTGFGEGYAYGIISTGRPDTEGMTPEERKEALEAYRNLTQEQKRELIVWGITSWDTDKLGPEPTEQEIEAEAQKQPVPKSATPRQLRLALIDEGIMPSDIEAALNAITDPTERVKALTEWEYALTYERNHPLVETLGQVFEKSSDDLDDLFRKAIKK